MKHKKSFKGRILERETVAGNYCCAKPQSRTYEWTRINQDSNLKIHGGVDEAKIQSPWAAV